MWKREKLLRIFTISGTLLMLIFSWTLQHAQVPRVNFRKVENREALRWASQWEADQRGLAIQPAGIYPLNKDTVFLFGELRTPPVSIRSLLLRSGDGGKSWREVMLPVHGSEVIEVFFHDAYSGWALVGWTTEGPGALALYRSKDGGNSWRKISDIPKRHHSGWPISMRFSDGKNGVIKLLYDGTGDPQTDGLVTLNTKNGGRSWHETSHLALDEYERAIEERKEAEERIVVGQDSSQWQLLDADGQVRILRRLRSDETWRVLCVMPSHFGYSKGEVLVHAVRN